MVAQLEVELARHYRAENRENGQKKSEYYGKGIVNGKFIAQKLGQPVVYAVLYKAVCNSCHADENECGYEYSAEAALCALCFRRLCGGVVFFYLAVFTRFFHLSHNINPNASGGKQESGGNEERHLPNIKRHTERGNAVCQRRAYCHGRAHRVYGAAYAAAFYIARKRAYYKAVEHRLHYAVYKPERRHNAVIAAEWHEQVYKRGSAKRTRYHKFWVVMLA